MNIKKEIHSQLKKVRKRNDSNVERTKKKIRENLRVNLLEKKESIQANQGLILRHQNAKPKQLTVMQQALMEVVC